MDESTHDEGDFDPSRKLCPDGSCVGVIGQGGVCSVCGRTEAEAEAGAEAPASFGGSGAGGEPGGQPDGDLARRRLCDDGACVGVVGDDGVCRICGRRAE